MSEHILRPLLPRYGLPPDAPLARLNLSENETWVAGDLILRLHRPGYHSPNEIRSELAWLEALRGGEALRCVRPWPACDGSLLQTAGDRLVVGFERIGGRELDAGGELCEWLGQLGAISARLHRQARGWTRPGWFARKRWDAETILGPAAHWGDWRAAPGLEAGSREVLERLGRDLCARLHEIGTGPQVFGLIHADLRLSNLLADGAGLWVIDFDDCGFGWWMFDFAAAVSFIETDPAVPDLAARWLEGYRSLAPLAREQAALLPVMVMLRRLQLTAWLASRAGNDTAAEFGGPEFTHGTAALAERFLARGPGGFWPPGTLGG